MNEEEIKKMKRRKKNARWKIIVPCILAVFTFFAKIIHDKFGLTIFDRFPHADIPMTWGEILQKGLLEAFLSGLFVFLFVYILQIVLNRTVFSGPDAMICMNCNKYKNNDKNYKCDCGGEFVPLDELEWVEE